MMAAEKSAAAGKESSENDHLKGGRYNSEKQKLNQSGKR
jgi:hypothetical protein